MSGHSKWSQIKRQKGANDVKRGAIFTKMGREIAVAARAGGGDPDGNFRLRLAIEKARAANMPLDTIKRAIDKATGGGEGEQYEEIMYEGYGPGGVAVIVQTATDNRNRTAADVRSIFSRAGGQLATTGAVAWQFEQRGIISVPVAGADPDEVALLAIDAGASDVETSPEHARGVHRAVRSRDGPQGARGGRIKVESADSALVAKQTVAVDVHKARSILRLVETLEDNDDVQRVTSNLEISEELLAEVAG